MKDAVRPIVMIAMIWIAGYLVGRSYAEQDCVDDEPPTGSPPADEDDEAIG